MNKGDRVKFKDTSAETDAIADLDAALVDRDIFPTVHGKLMTTLVGDGIFTIEHEETCLGVKSFQLSNGKYLLPFVVEESNLVLV